MLKCGHGAEHTSSQAEKSSPVPFHELPFILKSRGGLVKFNNWDVPPTDNYGLACNVGREYAAHFVQYLKDNPSVVGSNLLGRIAADIDFKDKTAAKGYWVGFFAHLECLIHAQSKNIDVFADLGLTTAVWGTKPSASCEMAPLSAAP